MHRMSLWLSGIASSFYFPSIRISDILEMLIIAFVVYQLLVWIKRTRAWTLLKGIITIGIFILIVDILNMQTLIFLANRLLNVAIIAAVVIFQPELRRALEQLGEMSIISSIFQLDKFDASGQQVSERFSDETLEGIVRATFEMAKVKTGALIVIARNETLDKFEKTGIAIDAAVSGALLINIFEKNTPLHDGAVIINGDRIVAATCYLPLSGNMGLGKELGTRHRAGVGISEESDSLTIIVSEETGTVSVAFRGELERHVSAERLRVRLSVLQNKAELKKKRKFRLLKGGNAE